MVCIKEPGEADTVNQQIFWVTKSLRILQTFELKEFLSNQNLHLTFNSWKITQENFPVTVDSILGEHRMNSKAESHLSGRQIASTLHWVTIAELHHWYYFSSLAKALWMDLTLSTVKFFRKPTNFTKPKHMTLMLLNFRPLILFFLLLWPPWSLFYFSVESWHTGVTKAPYPPTMLRQLLTGGVASVTVTQFCFVFFWWWLLLFGVPI